MLSYVSVEALTGRVIADLPNLAVGTLKTTIGKYETASATLPLDGAPSNWRPATRPHGAVIVALDEDSRPVWGGIVNERPTTHADSVSFSMVTAEEYLNRRYVGDYSPSNVPQNTIAQYLVQNYAVPNGLPFRVQIDGGNGVARTRTYTDRADKTVYAALGELSGVVGGPEWTVEWEWNNGMITPVFRIADRLGAAAPSGLGPGAWFTMPGSVTSATLTESTKGEDAANDVMATASGTENTRLQSSHHVYTGDGRPKLELRWSPSTSITDVATLEDHATRRLAVKQRGAIGLTFTATRTEAPRIFRDWRLGDDIGYDLTSLAWPNGLTGTARAVGVEMTDTNILPILVIDPASLDSLDTVDRSDSDYLTSIDGAITLADSAFTQNADGTWTVTSPYLIQRPDGAWIYTF